MINVLLLKPFAEGAALVRALPTVLLAASTVMLAWHHDGSIAASDWLPYATFVALTLATVLISSVARPSRLPLALAALVAAFGLWAGISAIWSPDPALARDEFLLCALYASVVVLQGQVLETSATRVIAFSILTATLAGSAVATILLLSFGDNPVAWFTDGRLTAPVSYVNAQAALSAIGFWPAILLAARRGNAAMLRAAALGGAVAMLAVWLMSQSKGGFVALAVSAVVVFAAVPRRLRLLPPVLVSLLLIGVGYEGLTEPFREAGPDPIRSAATIALGLCALGCAVGLAYALVDNRVRVGAAARRWATVAVATLGALALGAGVWQAAERVDDPGAWLDRQWAAFKSNAPTAPGTSSYLVSIGSNRYDFWRASLEGFRDHPLGGIGARGFGPFYLQEKESQETPARSHSLPLDALLETGVVGAATLAAAFGLALFGVARRRSTTSGAAALGALTYFVVHASGDWIWTFPAVGLPLFALVGIALADGSGRPLVGRGGLLAGATVAAIALLLFVPPWLSARITTAALAGDVPVSQLRWARTLDPFSVEPLLAEASLAASPRDAVPPLERAVKKRPRLVGPRYQLAQAYLAAGRKRAAEEQLTVAQRLFPGDERIAAELKRARAR